MSCYECHKPPYTVSTDRERLDLPMIHRYLSQESYWAKGIRMERLRRAIQHSFPFGLYKDGVGQIGFARVLSDTSAIAYVLDVFVLPEYRGEGLGVWLMEAVMNHPDLSNVRSWRLNTNDAHALYEKFGFKRIENDGTMMQIYDEDAYSRL